MTPQPAQTQQTVGLRAFWRAASPAERRWVGLGWLLSLAFCIASGLATVILAWSGLPLRFAGFTVYVTVYPPLLLASWWALCFGWAWAAPLVYAATFTLALYAGMPLAWALLFACSNPLGLAVYALGYRAIDRRPELHSGSAWLYFVMLAFAASVFGSAGALIWSYTNRIDSTGLLPIWQGWWLGGFLQAVLLVGPLLWLTRPRISAWLARRPDLLAPPPADSRRLALRLILVIVCAVLAYGAGTLGLAEGWVQRRLADADARQLETVQTLLSTAWSCYWVMALFVLFVGFFGYRSFRHWSAANDRLLAELELLARTDRLSGLLNRRAMEEALDEQLQRGRRHGEPAALLMVDIDHFKRINDAHGHAVGDAAIVALADTLRAGLRSLDRAARWGGEEFLVLLPQQDAAAAWAVAERLRAALATLPGPELPRFTVSVGVAALQRGDREWGDWLKRADGALYAAKAAGRDRVLAAD